MEHLPGAAAAPDDHSLEGNSTEHPSMFPPLHEEVETSIRKDGIAYIFESRSVSAVINFVYTPIDGTFSDIELEINNNDPINPADEGGVSVDMNGSIWAADSEEVERHFVSCDQIGDAVEARWQWKLGEEQASFLYRFRISGKSLIVEIEGGNGKGTGLSLGRVSGALNPRLIAIPYFNLGDNYPHILCTSGYFISNFIDWHHSAASSLHAPSTDQAHQELRLNDGCTYANLAGSKRNNFRERMLITASTHYEEVLPSISQPEAGQDENLAEFIWCNIPYLDASEESYVEIYENMRVLKLMGVDHLLVNHPAETWHDGDGNASLTTVGAEAKGGDDALAEYLEALADFGYKTSLQTNYKSIATTNPHWSPDLAAQLADGTPAPAGPELYLLKQSEAQALAPDHARALFDKYPCDALYITEHGAAPPWAFADFSHGETGGLSESYRQQRDILSSQSQGGIAVGQGGCHWLYAGLLNGFLARMPGSDPSHCEPLVDFALGKLHPIETDAGVGTIDQYFGGAVPQDEKHSRSTYLDRFIAATAAFGHAGLIPDQLEWGTATTIKTYFMLQELQKHYIRVPVQSIEYCHNGQFLSTNDALLSDGLSAGQIRIGYQNGLQIHANLSWEQTWTVEREDQTYALPPGSFCAWNDDGLLVYSADTGSGRIDFARCDTYLYVDTRGQALSFGPVRLDGAAVIRERKWEIDIVPFDCQADIEIHVGQYWPDRKLPPLRLLAFKAEEEEPDVYRADMDADRVTFKTLDDAIMYRITLPEWMVEPGQ